MRWNDDDDGDDDVDDGNCDDDDDSDSNAVITLEKSNFLRPKALVLVLI